MIGHRTKHRDPSISGPVRFESLKQRLPVVQRRHRGRESHLAERHDARLIPLAVIIIRHEHVIAVVRPEGRILAKLFAQSRLRNSCHSNLCCHSSVAHTNPRFSPLEGPFPSRVKECTSTAPEKEPMWFRGPKPLKRRRVAALHVKTGPFVPPFVGARLAGRGRPQKAVPTQERKGPRRNKKAESSSSLPPQTSPNFRLKTNNSKPITKNSLLRGLRLHLVISQRQARFVPVRGILVEHALGNRLINRGHRGVQQILCRGGVSSRDGGPQPLHCRTHTRPVRPVHFRTL